MTASIISCVSLGNARPAAVETIAQSTVPTPNHGYRRKYAQTRVKISRALRRRATIVSSLTVSCRCIALTITQGAAPCTPITVASARLMLQSDLLSVEFGLEER